MAGSPLDEPGRARRRGTRREGDDAELRWDVDPAWFAEEEADDLDASVVAPDEPLFEDLYDPDELAAIEAGPRSAEPATRMGQWRRTSAVGAVLTGLALGLQEVFEPEREREIVIEADADEPDGLPVRVYLDPDSPPGSLCVVAPDEVPEEGPRT